MSWKRSLPYRMIAFFRKKSEKTKTKANFKGSVYHVEISDVRLRTKTKTTNSNVFDLYDTIVRDENRDTDYWTLFGNEELNDKLSLFEPRDRQDLEKDLPNWTDFQLEIFVGALAWKPALPKEDLIIDYKSYLSAVILTFIKDDWEFICITGECMELLEKGQPKPIEVLYKIKQKIEEIEHDMQQTGAKDREVVKVSLNNLNPFIKALIERTEQNKHT